MLIKNMVRNKTSRFLLPCMRYHGKKFLDLLSKTKIESCGINDYLRTGVSIPENPYLYILINKKTCINSFNRLLEYLQYEDYFIEDYPVAEDPMDLTYHMIVLKVPAQFEKSYQHFLNGEYSKMYNQEQLKSCFYNSKNKVRENDLKILLKDSSSKENFINILKETFNINYLPETLEFDEHELPITLNLDKEVYFYEPRLTV